MKKLAYSLFSALFIILLVSCESKDVSESSSSTFPAQKDFIELNRENTVPSSTTKSIKITEDPAATEPLNEPSSNKPKNLETYESPLYGIYFSYPQGYTEDSQEKSSSIVFVDTNNKPAFWIEEKYIESMRNSGESDEQVYARNAYYLDNSPVSSIQINGLKAQKFVIESGSRTAFMIQDLTKSRILYIVFQGISEPEMNVVLSSFKLI